MPQFTKNAIIDSFIKLLNEKPLDKITVKDIVEDCGINRNTFYYYFSDIRTLVVAILNKETEDVLSKHIRDESWEEGFIAAVAFALENKKAIYHIYNSVSKDELERYLNTIAEDVMRRYIHFVSDGFEIAKEDKELIISFYKCALVGMVLDWTGSGMKNNPEELIRRLGKLFEGNIIHSLELCSKQ